MSEPRGSLPPELYQPHWEPPDYFPQPMGRVAPPRRESPQPSPGGFAMRREPQPEHAYGYGYGQLDPSLRPATPPTGAPPLSYPEFFTPSSVASQAYENPLPVYAPGRVERASEVPRQTMARLGDDPTAPNMSVPQGHFAEAVQKLNLTPQEQYLYQHHLDNLMGPGGFVQPSGEVSTLLQANVEGPDGRTYNIPTVWFGQQLPVPLARVMAARYGWDKWPSYADSGEAERRYNDMHTYLSQDISLIGR